ncbi:MAG: threonylcarbamoyl-AMP synthase [Candidatus Kapabacteria bacterium]|nr:threonylcarbamoyl-AMP synthase [Candidatus Kapabacteria bacterium]
MIHPATSHSVRQACQVLNDGGVVAIPTETVYGLACSIDRPEAIRRVFKLKRRPSDNPLIVHVHAVDQALELTASRDQNILRRLAEVFWPGPLTVVVSRSSKVSDLVSAGLDTVAIRMPAHPVALEILRGTQSPLAAPSANISGRPSPTRAQHVLDDFGDELMIIDGGACEHGLESTVVRVIGSECLILRQGALSADDLRHALPELFVRSANEADQRHRSPGTRYRHYAPKARVVICRSPEQVQDMLAENPAERAVVLTSAISVERNADLNARMVNAATLYDEFRRADALQVERIIVLCDDELSRNEALMNRLDKASESGGQSGDEAV